MFHYRDNSSFDLITSWREKKNPCALISLHSTNLVKSSAGITTKQVDEKKMNVLDSLVKVPLH